MTELVGGVEGWLDSPGDLLAILSVVGLLCAGVFFLVDSRLGGIRQSLEDLKESNGAQHDSIGQRLDRHATSAVHDQRADDRDRRNGERRSSDG